MRVDMAGFYAKVRARDLARHAHQWASLVTCAQERLAYAKALEKVPPQAKVLDWGCGNGHFSYFLAEQGYRPDAFALAEKPALLADRISFVQGTDRTSLPYPTACFDAVFALGVIEHVDEHGGSERDSLRELVRVLKPGGLLFVFHLPNRRSWIESVKWCTWRLGLTTSREHVRRFTRRSFESMISGLPLEIVEDGRYHFLPRATLGRLPGLRDAPAFVAAVDALDSALAVLFGPVTQNFFFILRKAG